MRVNICDATYNGVCNLGVKPTVSSDADDVICETHLLTARAIFMVSKLKLRFFTTAAAKKVCYS